MTHDIIDATTDVTYSPDDGGYYCTRYPDGATTAVFDSRQGAIGAARRGEWDTT